MNYILGSFKDIFVKLFFITIYLYAFSIVLMCLSHGLHYAVEFSSPRNAFSQLYLYFKWCYDNKDNLDYGMSIRILVALFTPNFLYKLLCSIKWKYLIEKAIIKIKQCLNTKCSNKDIYANNKAGIYADDSGKKERSYEDTVRLMNHLKQFLVQDIEQAIDKRLYEIFLASRKKN